MNLSPCTHCGKDFATTAATCPNCAGRRPIEPVVYVITAAIILSIVVVCGSMGWSLATSFIDALTG